MNAKAEEMRAKMKALSIPGLENSVSAGPPPSQLSSGSQSGSWASRPARPRPSLNVGGIGGLTMDNNGLGCKRPAPKSLIFTSPSPGPEVEQEHKLKEIMRKSGQLIINGHNYNTHIDDLELLGDLGNGTCGHVVKMRHKHTGEVIAVKQMRRTGNNDETKRIIMDLDVVLKSNDCEEIVLCLGCFITESDVWICMELMATCFDKLLKKLKEPIPEPICGKVAVATVKALNYLKECHGVIHRDVKPSNILLDTMGRVKLCDFGISGRLVDSKAKTRSAGCAAYMAPERIDPPNPNNPNYDIRADVWSLGITLVEMATGHFPYRDCKTDFEVLTKVLQDDPPLLPSNRFSREFELFVRDCLMKDPKDRPKYKKLLMHPFIKKYEREEIDVGAWYRSLSNNTSNSSLTTPNNNQLSTASFDSLSNISNVERTSFKPQPSPRVVRSWRPSNATPTASSTTPSTASPSPSYPSAISEQRDQNRRPSIEMLLEARRMQQSSSQPYSDISSQLVTSKPPPALPSPSEARASSSYRHHYASSVTDSPMMMRSSTSARREPSNYYERWQPPNGHGSSALGYTSPYLSRMSSTSSAYSGSYGSPHHYVRSNYEDRQPTSTAASSNSSERPTLSTVPRYGYRESPRSVRKFDFTYPQTSIVGSYHEAGSGVGASQLTSASPHHRSYARRQLSTEQHHVLPHYQQYTTSATTTSRGRSPPPRESQALPERGRQARLDMNEDVQPQPINRSPSQERQSRNYFPSSWRSTLSSWTPSFRRLRTASSDRSSNFDSTRRFQPSYRSWNEKDNFYPSMKR